MAYRFLPINALKEIEPWLKEYYNYERSMLHNNFIYTYKIYAENFGNYSKEEEETYLLESPVHKKSISDIEIPDVIDYEKQYECVMNVGKAIIIDLGEYDYLTILQMYYDYVDEETTTDNDFNIGLVLTLIASIYNKYRNTNGFFDFEEVLMDDKQTDYSYRVRPDLLKLYELFHLKKKIKSDTIRIEYNNEVITLDNFDNWFTNMITPYLDKYLGVSSLEEAQTELEKDYPEKKTKGRKRINQIADLILMGTYNLIQHGSFAEQGKSLTNKQAEFLLRSLKYLGLIEEDSSKDDIINLRATVSNLKKYSLVFNWWSIPMQKQSPNNPFGGKMKSAW